MTRAVRQGPFAHLANPTRSQALCLDRRCMNRPLRSELPAGRVATSDKQRERDLADFGRAVPVCGQFKPPGPSTRRAG